MGDKSGAPADWPCSDYILGGRVRCIDALDYWKVKEAILYHLEMTPEHCCLEVWVKKEKGKRNPRLLAQTLLRDTAAKWLKLKESQFI